jgi:periplasmic protein TonB
MLRNFTRAAGSAVSLALLTATPLAAQHDTHTSLVTLSDWTDRMTGMLDDEIRRLPSISRATNEGVVRVKFNCSATGRPDKVTLLKGSGSASLDARAIRVVKRLASLHPLPSGFKPDQKFVAVLVFASGASDPRIKAMFVEQRRNNKWYRNPAAAESSGTQFAIRQ